MGSGRRRRVGRSRRHPLGIPRACCGSGRTSRSSRARTSESPFGPDMDRYAVRFRHLFEDADLDLPNLAETFACEPRVVWLLERPADVTDAAAAEVEPRTVGASAKRRSDLLIELAVEGALVGHIDPN